MDYSNTIETDAWKLKLPSDWQRQELENNELYFESADGTKGLYISAWNLGDDIKTQREALELFVAAEEKGFGTMTDFRWEVMETVSFEGRASSVILDCYDQSHLYRIACKILVQLPIAVRATFHDYDCDVYAASKSFFDPIIDSLEMHA